MRKQYEMTQEQLKVILDACKPVPYMVIGGHEPRSPQENANAAWENLGKEMGFDYMTVQPTGQGTRFFTAEPIDPTPYCSYGHRTKESCDCLPIADNE